MRKVLYVGLVMALVVGFGFGVVAADKKKVVINELKATGVNPDTVTTLGDVLCSHVSNKHKDYNVVCSQDVKVILQSTNNSVLLGGCDDDKCLSKLGGLLKADMVLTGSVGVVGKKYVFNLSLVDVSAGASVARTSYSVDKDGDLIKAVQKAADDLWKNVEKKKDNKKK